MTMEGDLIEPAARGVLFANGRNARRSAAAAVGACARQDGATMSTLLQQVRNDRDDTQVVIAAEVLVDIILNGIPAEVFTRGSWITLAHEESANPSLVRLVNDLVSHKASGEAGWHTRIRGELIGDYGLNILVALVRAATARIRAFVSVESDVIEAYCAYRYTVTGDLAARGRHWKRGQPY